MQILGTELSSRLQRQVLSMYVHRFTGNHRPEWTNKPMSNGKEYPLHFMDDSDWLAHTFFEVTVKGEISRRTNYCESSPTWPLNPELRR